MVQIAIWYCENNTGLPAPSNSDLSRLSPVKEKYSGESVYEFVTRYVENLDVVSVQSIMEAASLTGQANMNRVARALRVNGFVKRRGYVESADLKRPYLYRRAGLRMTDAERREQSLAVQELRFDAEIDRLKKIADAVDKAVYPQLVTPAQLAAVVREAEGAIAETTAEVSEKETEQPLMEV